ncbi:MAG TPA: PspC domain-containing protein [Pelolinea sp.]|nr:PspC domain-containing protein [Pelolinea sp.]
MKNRLYRSETNRVLAGVCGGLGEFLGIDPVFIRIFFIVWTVLGEFSVLIYFILWVVVPNRTASDAGEKFSSDELGARFRLMGSEIRGIASQPSSELITFAGVGLIGWGVYYLLRRFGFPWIAWDYTLYLWPALLIIAGVIVLIRATKRNK